MATPEGAAAITEARVAEIVQAALVSHAATVENQVGIILAGVKNELATEINTQIARANELSTQLTTQSDKLTEACRMAHERVDQQVVEVNSLRVQLGEKFSDIDAKQTLLSERIVAFDGQMEVQKKKISDDLTAVFNTMNGLLQSTCGQLVEQLKTEFASTRSYIDSVEKRISESGLAGGTGTGAGYDRKSKLSAKDCPVAKLPEKCDILDFRQWLTTIERQLESAFNLVGIDEVFQKMRFIKDKIDKPEFDILISECHGESTCAVTDGL